MSVLSAEHSAARPYRKLVRITPWTSVIVLGVLIAWVDGFIMVTLRGAVGYIGRTQGPFATWMIESVMYLPLFLLAVWGAFMLARRWAGDRHPLAVTAGLIALVTGVVAIVLTALNAVYDYQLQAQQLDAMMQSTRDSTMYLTMQPSLDDSAAIQVKAVAVVSVVLVLVNLMLVGWVAALRGGRLVR